MGETGEVIYLIGTRSCHFQFKAPKLQEVVSIKFLVGNGDTLKLGKWSRVYFKDYWQAWESCSEIPKGSVIARELMTAEHLYPQDWREKEGQFPKPGCIEAVTFSCGIKLTSVNITGVVTSPTSSHCFLWSSSGAPNWLNQTEAKIQLIQAGLPAWSADTGVEGTSGASGRYPVECAMIGKRKDEITYSLFFSSTIYLFN